MKPTDRLGCLMTIQMDRENKLQHAVLDLKKKYGRDAVLKGMNLEKSATAIERNHQIGGHRSGN